MRIAVTILLTLLLNAFANGQKLSQVSFLDGSSLSHFTIRTDQDVLIRIGADGQIIEYGYEVMSYRGDYYAPQLQPFLGRIEYYGTESDPYFSGKLKSVGTAYFTYYGPHEEEQKKGKLKSIGRLEFDYYSRFDEKSLQGKLKLIGFHPLEYYRSYENEAVRGKLKSIGNMAVTYYTSLEGRYNIGKLKSIGGVQYAWYTPMDQARGGLKTYNYRANIGGITMVLR